MAQRTGRVLIVDDEPSHHKTLRRQFMDLGWQTFLSSTVDAATKILRESSVDLIVVEPNLTNTNWYGAITGITSAAPGTPFFVATSFPSEALRQQVALLGGLGCVRKPADIKQICDRLVGGRCCEEMSPRPHPRSLALNEWEYINQILREHAGNISASARVLKIPRQTFYRKLRKHPPSG
jgi:two-component system response regulator RegA